MFINFVILTVIILLSTSTSVYSHSFEFNIGAGAFYWDPINYTKDQDISKDPNIYLLGSTSKMKKSAGKSAVTGDSKSDVLVDLPISIKYIDSSGRFSFQTNYVESKMEGSYSIKDYSGLYSMLALTSSLPSNSAMSGFTSLMLLSSLTSTGTAVTRKYNRKDFSSEGFYYLIPFRISVGGGIRVIEEKMFNSQNSQDQLISFEISNNHFMENYFTKGPQISFALNLPLFQYFEFKSKLSAFYLKGNYNFDSNNYSQSNRMLFSSSSSSSSSAQSIPTLYTFSIFESGKNIKAFRKGVDLDLGFSIPVSRFFKFFSGISLQVSQIELKNYSQYKIKNSNIPVFSSNGSLPTTITTNTSDLYAPTTTIDQLAIIDGYLMKRHMEKFTTERFARFYFGVTLGFDTRSTYYRRTHLR